MSMKVAYITGASRGLGKYIADYLSDEYSLVLGCNNTSITNNNAVIIKGDVSDPETSKRTLQTIRDNFGRLDLFVANAGIELNKLFIDLSEEEWNKSLGINLNGIFYALRDLGELLISSKGSVVIISSILGKCGVKGGSAYAAAKSALLGLARTAAKEWAPNVKINVILPGYLDTDMGKATPKALERAMKENLTGKLGSFKDVAEMIKFLAASEGITGQIFSADGRLSLW